MNEITFQNKTASLTTTDRLVYDTVRKSLTFAVPGAKYSSLFKAGRWDGKKCFLTGPGWNFPAGLVPHVQTALAKKKFVVPVRDIRDHSNTAPAPPDAVIVKSLTGTVLRDYQIAAVQAIFEHTRGIIQAPTGSGKTKIAVAAMNWAIRTKGLKTLLLTHKQELLNQTEKSLRESTGIEAAIFGDGESPLMKPANIGMVQTLAGRLRIGVGIFFK